MSLIEDLKLEKSKKNTPKMQYFKYKNEIDEALKAGYTIKDIHNVLIKYDNINISYEMLRFYISKSKNKEVKNDITLKNSKTVKKSKGFKQNPKAFEEPKEKKQEMASAFSNYKKEDLI